MSGSSDKNGSKPEGQAKRPTPTIEGTATEVSVEPDRDEPKIDESKSGAPADAEPEKGMSEGETPGDRDAHAGTQAKLGTDKGEPPERRSLAAAVLGTLTSLLTHALAGLIGGLAVLLAITLGYLPLGTDQAGTALLEDRIAKLESVPAAPDNTASLQALEQHLAAFESKTPEAPAELTALSGRVAQLETTLKSMSEAAEEGGSVAGAAAISQQINEAEQRLGAKIGSKIQSEIQSVLADEKIETAVDTKAIETLKAEIAEIDAKLKALANAKLGSDEAAQLLPEITVLDERLARIESTLPALVKTVDEGSTGTKKATFAIAFANLREAVNDGRPYTSELSTLGVLSPGALDLGSLLDYEEMGIPTLPTLTASFDTLRDKAVADEPDGGSLVSWLLGSAGQLVKVKRVDEAAEGDTPDAVLARASAKLYKGDLAAAVTEVQMLQGPPAKIFANWLDEAKARLEARAILRRLQNILLVTLGPDEAGSGEADNKKTEEQE